MTKSILAGLALVLLLVSVATVVVGQQGQNVVISQGPPIVPYQKLLFYASSNLTYVCTANSTNLMDTLSVSAATRASPGVFTSVAHGFSTYSRPKVRFKGTMPTGWSSLTSVLWIMTPIDADTFSLTSSVTGTALDTSGFSNAWSGTASFESQAPRTSKTYWSIQWLQYDGSNNVIATMNAYGPGGLAGAACDSRTSGATEWR